MIQDGSPEAAKALIREIAASEPAGNTKHAIAKAARAIGVGFRRAFGLFYGTARRIDAQEWLAMQAAALRLRRLRAARLRTELEAIERQLESDACAPVCAWQPTSPNGSLTAPSLPRTGASAGFGG